MFESILAIIQQYDSIIINGHANPDGDCYGSQIGLKEIIINNFPNKKVYVVGAGLPRFFSLLGNMDSVSDDTFKQSLIIVLDGNDLSRMEDKRVFTGKAFAKIDHHVDKHSFTEGPEVLIEDSSSTAEIIVRFAKECHLKMTKKASNALYLGILTDSGRFQFSSNFKEMFNHVSWLCECGANPKELTDVLNVTDERLFKIRELYFKKYQKSEGGTIYTIIRHSDIANSGYSSIEVANMLNIVGNIQGCLVWTSFVEGTDGRVKVEVRSAGPDVQPLTLKYGGGGHMKAAGMTLPKYDEKVILQFVNELDQAIKQFKK